MTLGEVGPAFIRCFHCEVRIEIAVFTLGGRHQFNDFIGRFFKFRIGFLAQGPGNGLQPLCYVAILKNHAVKFAILQARGDTEILYRMTWFRLCNAVIERIPLIGDHHVTHQLLILSEERIADGELMQVDFQYVHFVLLKAVHDADADRWQCATSSDY